MSMSMDEIMGKEAPQSPEELLQRLKNGRREFDRLGRTDLANMLELAELVAEIAFALKDREYAKSTREA